MTEYERFKREVLKQHDHISISARKIDDYDIAITYAYLKEAQETGKPVVNVSAEKTLELVRKHCGDEVYEGFKQF